MINSKWTRTSSKTICNEKEALWMQIAFHCNGKFGIMGMYAITFQNLNLYLAMDHK
jgi:hypothetical protein